MSADLYQQRMLELARAADRDARLDDADASASLDNPMCGDRVTIDLRRDGDGRVAALGHAVRGCVLCRAATALLQAHAPGEDEAGIAAVREGLRARLREGEPLPADPAWADLAVFEPVAAHKSRHDCVLLAFDALLDALRER